MQFAPAVLCAIIMCVGCKDYVTQVVLKPRKPAKKSEVKTDIERGVSFACPVVGYRTLLSEVDAECHAVVISPYRESNSKSQAERINIVSIELEMGFFVVRSTPVSAPP